MENCLFCKIAHQQINSHVIAENEDFMAFLSIYPNTLGVTVVIPKQHYPSYIFDLYDQLIAKLMQFSKSVAKRLDQFFDDVGRTALVFEGFGVDHVHAKLFPMHGTAERANQWQQINSNIDHYFEQYQGYISSHDAQEMPSEALATLAQKIREMP
ncbi:Diadenosine tetraphosphate (Ap4A) hydrolase [Acinetobacter marinus]|uniref:Diadenosine tetraphosphate (Ap4A) hydrolase n=1 Tax=Acinetobacter marinus TaxID=281375 RepID=A0A1G6HGK0_9GAMM|nr:HIT family protein [Acinetobacter marinus]SDB92576.1 Diadenosine tetraphosphate (Ap4A) hydrolase [Acinetobacter marinus]